MENLKEKNEILKRKNCITLISLVITIIIVLILATISIQAITNTGLFEKTNKAKLETKRSQIKEWLSFNLMEAQTTNYNKTDSKILEIARQKVENSEELSKLGKTVSVDKEISTEEDGEIVDAYFYVIVDRDVYKVDISGARFIGEQGKLKPKVTIQNITSTTNSITVKVKTSRNEGGKIEYYIKAENEDKYELKEIKADDTEYTFINLIQGKKYNIKVIAKVENRPQTEVIVNQTTGSVTGLTSANVKFTYSPSTWTNTNVTATASTDITGFTLQTSKDGSSWSSTAAQTYNSNGTIYARLTDGTNVGASASGSFTLIDKTVPSVNISLSETEITTEGTITATVTQSDSQSGVNTENCKWVYNTTSGNIGTNSSSYTGTFTSTTQNLSLSSTTEGTYYLHVLSVDNAGNEIEKISNEIIIKNKNVYLYNYGQINTELVGGISQHFRDSLYKGGTFGFSTDHYYSGETGTSSYNTCCAKFNKAIDFTDFSTLKITCQLTDVRSTYSASRPSGSLSLSEYDDYDIRSSHNTTVFDYTMFPYFSTNSNIQTFEIDISEVKGAYYLYTITHSGALSGDTAILRVYKIELLQ